MNTKPVRVIALASGKGGVGKSFLTLHLAEALARMGRSVAILDADLGLGNIELMAGVAPRHTLMDVLSGHCTLEDVILEGPVGIQIIPGGRRLPILSRLDTLLVAGMIQAMDSLAGKVDYLLVDTAGGLSPIDLQLVQAAGEVLVVLTAEPVCQLDTADYIRVLRQHCRIESFGILTNMVRRQREGHALMQTLQHRLGFDLDLVLHHCGQVPFERNGTEPGFLFTGADREQSWQESRVLRSLSMLAVTLDRCRPRECSSAGMRFFLEQTLSAGGGKAWKR
ncbi:MAG: P-loop NTPase [Kistimonas sp.]|nr:P-loop NTPase [Kistimonas sp.]